MSTNGEDTTAVPEFVVINLTFTLDATKTPSVVVAPTLPELGLSATKHVLDESSLAEILTSLRGEHFSLSQDKLTDLGMQMAAYFKTNGIYDDEILSIVTDYSISPSTVASPMVTVPVTMCLSKIAKYNA